MPAKLSGFSQPLAVAARVLFALPFLAYGAYHFMNLQAMAETVPFSGGTVWVVVAGACMILAGVSLLFNRAVALSMPLLAILMIVYVVALHVPEAMNPDLQMLGVQHILRDLALAGGALAFAALAPARK